jgi:hypothetical protein
MIKIETTSASQSTKAPPLDMKPLIPQKLLTVELETGSDMEFKGEQQMLQDFTMMEQSIQTLMLFVLQVSSVIQIELMENLKLPSFLVQRDLKVLLLELLQN